MRASLKVSGMTCVNCARAIEISLKRLKGIQRVEVSFELGRVAVDFDEELLSPDQIGRVIESLGYRVEKVEGKKRSLEILLFCWSSSLLIMALMFVHSTPSLYTQVLLAIAIQLIGGYGFYKGAISSLRARVGNMDLLVALGSTSALLYSLLTLFDFLPGEPFFETSAFLITFVKTGKFLEEWVKSKALRGLKDLFSLQTVRLRVFKDGREIEKTPLEVFVGDTLILRSGDMVAVDCRVLEGSLEVDESLVSGESLPVRKSVGDRLISGSVVLSGFAKAKVEKTFSSSYANLLVRLVEETLSKKPRIHRLADRFSHYFVQFVLLLSLLTFLFWYASTGDLQKAVNFSLAVLVVSCPCAFGIAVPLALTVGLFRAYKRGVLIKDPSALEKEIDILLLDKTGTLTEGKPKLIDLKLYHSSALFVACGLAKASNHPYSQSIRDFCRSKGLEGENFENCKEEAGVGVICGDYMLGRSEEGVALYKNGTKLAEFYFEDRIRPEAKRVVDFLLSKGIRVCMLTGDREDKARVVARELGIAEFFAKAKPEDKLRKVEELKAEGYRVGLAGDGINDAPAMARADLSFALGSGTDMAKRAGDVILLRGLEGLREFFDIKVKTMRRIRENLFWAFIYNLVGIPIAGGLLYLKGIYLKPEYAGLMMAFSSLSVVLNSIRK
ncbi:cation-translocating P-type ATPase [Hydrogenobacter sp. T-2]|uniref:heavy metal translocating P-type ATPase n=1 Tax=Pampinifervens diazotrophicum TaxID=1632018 RepID=UPI002B264189|nr:cation-translocating P-type ATPase [Hydrogenobacter sp. T-2]WPM31604.1 cation-translocating P-type ATPase [Hydrogenobacter sp. T-2]